MKIKEAFNKTLTENGDNAYLSTNNQYLDVLFSVSNLRINPTKTNIILNPDSEYDRLFAMLVRDPRFGLGERDLGRYLLNLTKEEPENILEAGRADDIFYLGYNLYLKEKKDNKYFSFLREELSKNNELVKKWMPRKKVSKKDGENVYRNIDEVNAFIKCYPTFMNDRMYRKMVKVETTESHLTNKDYESIEYSKVPSLALLKYFKAFSAKDSERFNKYLNDVEKGKEKMNVSVMQPYDIARNVGNKITYEEADIIFKNLPKANFGRILPIVDNSGSMYDSEKSYLKARAIGHYVAKNSDYMNNHIITFSSEPKLLQLGSSYREDMRVLESFDDVSNTDFGKVMSILKEVDEDLPDFLLVLSDMQFDQGSQQSKDEAMEILKKENHQIKIIWWNFNTREVTMPETDKYGNIFISGYNAKLLELLEIGFDGKAFLDKLIQNYKEKISEKIVF